MGKTKLERPVPGKRVSSPAETTAQNSCKQQSAVDSHYASKSNGSSAESSTIKTRNK